MQCILFFMGKMSHFRRQALALDNDLAVFKVHTLPRCCEMWRVPGVRCVFEKGFCFLFFFIKLSTEVFSRRNSHSGETD